MIGLSTCTYYSSTAILVPGAVAVQVATAVDSVNCKVGGVFPVTFQLLLHCSVNVSRANFMRNYIAYCLEHLLKQELKHLLKEFST